MKYRIFFTILILCILFSLTCVNAVEDNQTVDDVVLQTDSIEDDLLTEDPMNSFSDLYTQLVTGNNVTLDRDYTFDSHRDVPIAERGGISVTKSDIVIDGNGHTINALGQSRIFEVRGSNVILKNINFINANSSGNGGAVYFSKSATVINCNFTNNVADKGGAIYFYYKGTVIDSKFSENGAYSDGGAIYGYFSTNITGSEFQNNHANNGGAMLLNLQAYLNSVALIDNVADNFGGALYLGVGTTATINNSSFERNKALYSTFNIYLSQNAKILPDNLVPSLIPQNLLALKNTISACNDNILRLNYDYYYTAETDSEFLENRIEINHDGLTIDGQGHTINCGNCAKLFSITSSGVTLKNINFIDIDISKYSLSGGAIESLKDLKVDNCSFENVKAYFGGAINQDMRSKLTVTNSRFINNQADTGGAIVTYWGLIDNCTFINNTAREGGAVSVSETTITNSTFINNKATSSRGGAISIIRNGLMRNNTFIGNSARSGGAIYSMEESNQILDSVFESNDAVNGGAIYIYWGGSITNSEFKANKATENGGAIYSNVDGIITSSVFTLNIANNNGGGVFINKGSLTLSNFTNNSAGNGGAVYSFVGLNQLIIINNTAKNGGGLYSESGQVKNITFKNNVAYANGGALYLTSGRNVVDCSFSGNAAADKGGAILFNGQSTVNNVNFTNNSAKNGGAIYNNNVLTVNNTNFKGDHAYSGGAIQISANLNLHNTNFEDNTATEGTNYINLIGNVRITLDNVTPRDVNPFKVSTMTITYVTNGTVYGDESNITVNVISENKPITEGFAIITLNDVNYTAYINNGIGLINVTNVDAGRYVCNITYISYNYTKDVKLVDFYISKRVMSLSANISNITVGETLNFTVELNNGENINSGTISTIINNKEYVENIINGTAAFEIQNLAADNYVAFIVCNCGSNYYNPTENVDFRVFKRNVTLESYVENITQGNVLKISINVTNDDTVINEGFILLTINNDTLIEYVINGTVSFEIQNLDAGNYVCNVTYIGGKNNTNKSEQVRFNVNEKIYSIEVSADNITYGGIVKITTDVKSNAGAIVKGKVFFELNERLYEKALEDGRAIFEIPNLDAGIYVGNIVVKADDGFISPKMDVNFKVSPKIVLIRDYAVLNNTYGETLKIIVNVTCADQIINNGSLFIYFANESYNASVRNGSATIEIPNLDAGKYDGELAFDGGINYQKSKVPISFEVLQNSVDFAVNFTNITYGDVLKVRVNVASGNIPVNEGNVTISFNNENYTANVENAVALIEIPNLDAGKYVGNVAFNGGNNYNNVSKSISFEVSQKIVNITINVSNIAYGEVLKVRVSVISNNVPVNEGNVTVVVNDENYAANVESGVALIEIPNLDVGKYDGNVTFYAGDNYNKVVKTIRFDVLKGTASISASNKAYIINYDGKYSITLKDAKGGAIAGKKVTFTLNGASIGSAITNSKGVATIKLTAKILKKAKSGTKNLVMKFTDKNYNTLQKTTKITIKKEKTKIKAKKKTFKRTKKVKKYKITLKDSKGKAIKKAKVTLKIKKKTFKAKTNAKGKATFKIKKLTKKGTFKAKITFKGNAYYNKVTKKVKIKMK